MLPKLFSGHRNKRLGWNRSSSMLLNKLETSKASPDIKNLLVALFFFITSQNVYMSFVQWQGQ